LVTDVVVEPERNRIFALMNEASFNPEHCAVLETPPNPPPVRSASPGTVRLVEDTTDSLTLEADLSSPALLVVTDAYAGGWRAVGLPGTVQKEYHVMPANYVLRAVPLSAGHHRFRMEYAPRAFVGGSVDLCDFTRRVCCLSRLVCGPWAPPRSAGR